MKSVLTLSWRRSLLSRNQSIDLQSKSMDWFLYDRDIRHKRINTLLLAYIHWDLFLGYEKIIDICTSKYQRRMLLINPPSKNYTVETFNARKTYKAYTQTSLLRFYMKMIWQTFHIKRPFTFWDMWKVCLQKFRNNRICKKLAYFLRNL